MHRRNFIRAVAGMLALATAQAGVAKDSWPTRPVRLLVPTAAGGAIDIVSRLVSEAASTTLGQNVVVDNRPGSAQAIAINIALSAAPDGYTFITLSDNGLYQPLIRKGLNWSVESSFVPVSLLITQPMVIVVNVASGISSLQELIAKARSSPLQYAVASAGSTQHLAGALLAKRAGFAWTPIPYKGGGAAIQDLVGGSVPIGILGPGPVLPHVKSGRLKILATTSPQRSPLLPHVPTVAESGYAGFEVVQWIGVFARPGTPIGAIARMQRECAVAVTSSKSTSRLQSLGLDAVGSSSVEFEQRIRKDAPVWFSQAKSLGIGE
jgi:tripartite-type tricarboxylate transporter receptor subunit TctC